MRLFANGGWRDAAHGRVFVNGAWRTITRAMAYVGGTWRTAVQFAPPLGVSVPDETYVAVGGTPFGSGGAYVVATPSGGIAPYSYSWSVTSHSGAVTPSLSTPTLAGTSVNGGAYQSSVDTVLLSVTVTDAIGQTAAGGTTVLFENIWGL